MRPKPVIIQMRTQTKWMITRRKMMREVTTVSTLLPAVCPCQATSARSATAGRRRGSHSSSPRVSVLEASNLSTKNVFTGNVVIRRLEEKVSHFVREKLVLEKWRLKSRFVWIINLIQKKCFISSSLMRDRCIFAFYYILHVIFWCAHSPLCCRSSIINPLMVS